MTSQLGFPPQWNEPNTERQQLDAGLRPSPYCAELSASYTLRQRTNRVRLGTVIHFLDVFDKFDENVAQGWMFASLIVGCLVATLALVHRSTLLVWTLAAACGLAPIAGYIVSRSVGLAGGNGDIGNWKEPLGLASLSVEASLVMVSVYGFLNTRRSADSALRS